MQEGTDGSDHVYREVVEKGARMGWSPHAGVFMIALHEEPSVLVAGAMVKAREAQHAGMQACCVLLQPCLLLLLLLGLTCMLPVKQHPPLPESCGNLSISACMGTTPHLSCCLLHCLQPTPSGPEQGSGQTC